MLRFSSDSVNNFLWKRLLLSANPKRFWLSLFVSKDVETFYYPQQQPRLSSLYFWQQIVTPATTTTMTVWNPFYFIARPILAQLLPTFLHAACLLVSIQIYPRAVISSLGHPYPPPRPLLLVCEAILCVRTRPTSGCCLAVRIKSVVELKVGWKRVCTEWE